MIINLRGTSGSGKSTLVRWVMAQHGTCRPVYVEKRRQPLYYRLWRSDYSPENDDPVRPDLVVLGHYETACGGCDTIGTVDEVFALVREHASTAAHVLFEGLLLGVEVNRTVALLGQIGPHQLEVIFLDTPLDVCLASINKRRWAKDPAKPPVDPTNTASKLRALQGIVPRLTAGGVTAYTASRLEAKLRLGEIFLSAGDEEGLL